MRHNKGQNTVEYVLLVAAVLLVCIYFFAAGGPMSQGVNSSLGSIVNDINHMNSNIQFPGVPSQN